MKKFKFSFFIFISLMVAFAAPTICMSGAAAGDGSDPFEILKGKTIVLYAQKAAPDKTPAMQSGEGLTKASPATPLLADLH